MTQAQLIGVYTARLKCLNPAFFIISAIFASPACTPKTGPLLPLLAIDDNVHIIQDAA